MSTDPYGAPTGSTPEPLGPPNPGPPSPGDLQPLPHQPAADADVKEVKFTRAAALWSAVIIGLLILIVLLIFIAQNTESAQFAFLGWSWSLPLGVAILGAAVCGGLLTVAVGTVRLFQLRKAAKRNLKAARR
ncbi:LapA family protein [Mycobacterium sp. NPDC050041]|uniref:LapA family protein n=1 Tax=Mycobacterium sp. NPDC050041 TaxID=3364293 RepID=UPI003C2FA239